MGTFRVLIAGGKHFADYKLLRITLAALLANRVPGVELLTCGGSRLCGCVGATWLRTMFGPVPVSGMSGGRCRAGRNAGPRREAGCRPTRGDGAGGRTSAAPRPPRTPATGETCPAATAGR